jgi:chromatin remodeling complex protein RSC6
MIFRTNNPVILMKFAERAVCSVDCCKMGRNLPESEEKQRGSTSSLPHPDAQQQQQQQQAAASRRRSSTKQQAAASSSSSKQQAAASSSSSKQQAAASSSTWHPAVAPSRLLYSVQNKNSCTNSSRSHAPILCTFTLHLPSQKHHPSSCKRLLFDNRDCKFEHERPLLQQGQRAASGFMQQGQRAASESLRSAPDASK